MVSGNRRCSIPSCCVVLWPWRRIYERGQAAELNTIHGQRTNSAMEEDPGRPLFVRNTKSVQLTAAGRVRVGISEDLKGSWLPKVSQHVSRHTRRLRLAQDRSRIEAVQD